MKRIATWLLALVLALAAIGLGVTLGAVALAWDRAGSPPVHLVQETVSTLGSLAYRGNPVTPQGVTPAPTQETQEFGLSLD